LGNTSLRPSLAVHLLRTMVGITVGTAIVSPRTIPYTTSLLAASLIAALYSEGRLRSSWPRLETAEWLVLGFIAFCAVSMAWEEDPAAAIVPVLTAFACFCGCIFMMQVFLRESSLGPSILAQALFAGLVFGILYLFIEIFTHQSIKLAVYNALHIPKEWLRPPVFFRWDSDRLVEILPVDLTRNIAPLSLMLWAGLLVATLKWRPWVAIALFAIAFIVIMFSEHETSKVAVVWSGLIYLLARHSPLWSHRLLCAAWVFACLAIVPLTLTLHRLDLHNQPFLQPSFRHRIIIWNHTAEETLKSPVFGIGAGMMYHLDPGGVVPETGEEWSGGSPHAHNIYLETWFELGAIGAALLMLFGLALLDRIRGIAEEAGPFAQATFASAMAIAAASYGMWQPWLDRKSTRLNSSHQPQSRMPSSA